MLSLNGRYIGARYADVRNSEKVDSYFTLDAHYTYRLKIDAISAETAVWIAGNNLLDERYISKIGSADMLEDTPAYYVGAPRSVMAGLEARF
jgi:iron complex outermembrane recepter protein